MALVVRDRVKETTTTTGTGTITLLGAVSGYQAFSVIGNTNTTYYAIVDSAAGTWEVGIGTYSTTGPTLARDTILESSSGGTAISFAAGTKDVFCTYPADRSMYVDGTTITPAIAATLPVVSGGTGAATLAANNVLLGNGTGALQVVAPSTAGNVLTSNGTTWTSSPASGGGSAATPTALGTVYGNTPSGTPFNTSIGYNALPAITTGLRNTAFGYESGLVISTSNDCTFFGHQAGKAITTNAAGNTAFGSLALTALTTGQGNTAIGVNALDSATGNAGQNTAVGRGALQASTSASGNTAVGAQAGGSVTGSGSVFIGDRAGGQTPTSMDNCVLVGTLTGNDGTTNDNLVGVGYRALMSCTGANNTALGYQAGATGTGNLTSGVNNIIIGYNATTSSATVSNETTIGNISTTSARIFGDLQFLNSYTEQVFAVTGTTPALSPANGTIQTWTLTANSTPTAGTWNAGQSITLMIDDGSAFTVTWTSLAITWKTDAGVAPTLNTTGFTAITLWKVGTTIYGARVGNA